ncbi:MAG: hypothetical protein ACD_79C00795G0001 [uncultured bacterium]|nr:MAG: hypothetical protein ACD_79C00795G0001 [uncultured bacterium]
MTGGGKGFSVSGILWGFSFSLSLGLSLFNSSSFFIVSTVVKRTYSGITARGNHPPFKSNSGVAFKCKTSSSPRITLTSYSNRKLAD